MRRKAWVISLRPRVICKLKITTRGLKLSWSVSAVFPHTPYGISGLKDHWAVTRKLFSGCDTAYASSDDPYFRDMVDMVEVLVTGHGGKWEMGLEMMKCMWRLMKVRGGLGDVFIDQWVVVAKESSKPGWLIDSSTIELRYGLFGYASCLFFNWKLGVQQRLKTYSSKNFYVMSEYTSSFLFFFLLKRKRTSSIKY